jgi:urea transporter
MGVATVAIACLISVAILETIDYIDRNYSKSGLIFNIVFWFIAVIIVCYAIGHMIMGDI